MEELKEKLTVEQRYEIESITGQSSGLSYKVVKICTTGNAIIEVNGMFGGFFQIAIDRDGSIR